LHSYREKNNNKKGKQWYKRKTEQNKSKQNGKNDKNKTIHIGVGF
jgi:hypothetical protein